jgi:hypothetical protein
MKLLLASLPLLLQAPGPDRIESALRKFGERTYSMNEGGKKAGTWTMKTRLETSEGRKTAVFEDEVDVTIGEKTVKMSMKETADPSHLRLLSAKRSGKEMDWSVVVDGARAKMVVDGREQIVEITETTVGEMGVIRLLCAAEQKPDSTFKVDVLSMTAERLQKEHLCRCAGKEVVEIAGKKIDTFKWEEKWELKGTLNGVSSTSRVDNTYWVSPEGYLVRAGGPERIQLVLEMK